jgi:hypothetical protein
MAQIARRDVPHAASELETLDGILQYCQETSRHNGHADILCELIDGRTGR